MAKRSKPIRKAPPRPEDIAVLVAELEDALGTARAFALALELMGLGLRELGDDYCPALVSVSEAVLKHLDSARGTCARIAHAA